MSTTRRIQLLWGPIVMLAVAGFLIWNGARILYQPTGHLPGWAGCYLGEVPLRLRYGSLLELRG